MATTTQNDIENIEKKFFTDESLSKLIEEIKTYANNAATEASSSKSDEGHVHDDKYYTKSEMNTKLDEKTNTGHEHNTSSVAFDGNTGSYLQANTNLNTVIATIDTTLQNKADSEHGTHVTYATVAPLVNGTASIGTAETVSRSDHVHPIDESRASQLDLDSHTTNTSIHITSNERSTWNNKVPNTRKINNKELSGDIGLTASDVGADSSGSASNALTNANLYTDSAISQNTTKVTIVRWS